MDFMTPAYVGAAAAGGLYVSKYLRGSNESIGLMQLALAAGTAAASAFVAPGVSARLVCPHSPGAPLVEAATSGAASWAALAVLSSTNDASMFLPVQIGAYLAGSYAAKYMRAMNAQKAMPAQSDVESYGPP